MSKQTEVGALMDLYLEYREETESPYIFHRWSFLSCMAAALSRNLYVSFGSDRIYPNMYCVLLGSAGSRKSHAIKQAAELLAQAGYNKFSGDKTSPEKFISDLSVGFDTLETESLGELNLFESEETKDVFIRASELEDFLGPNNGAFISMLTNMWDNPPYYKHRLETKNSKKVESPTVSLLGAATQTTFKTIFPEGIIGQGMLSRMVIVHAPGQRKKVDFPPPPDKEIGDILVKEFRRVLDMRGEVKLGKEARRVWGELYRNFEDIDDERLENYSSRRHIHLMKLCIILSAMNDRYEILPEDIIYANTILTYTERFMTRALGEFGSTDESKKMTSLLKLIRKHTEGINMKNLAIGATEQGISLNSLGVLLTSLVHLKKVDRVEHDGEPLVLATKNNIKNDTDFCDFNLLVEYTSTQGADLKEPTESSVMFDFKTSEKHNDTNDFVIQ